MKPVEVEIGDRLNAQSGTLATAESCVGGLIAHRITNVEGSSQYFLGGIVSYSNDAKMKFLNVNAETLESSGAVSEAVAREMVEGARAGFGADYAVSVTGIAGPGGGTADKPVGLVYIGVASPEGASVQRVQFQGDRESVKVQTAQRALELLLEAVPE